MAKVVNEENALVSRQEISTELAPTAAAAIAQHEIQSAIVIARKFPRSEDQAFAKLMKACHRTSFAEDAEYSFPRGGTNVIGPSVNIAREAARVWGNLRYGLYVLRDDEQSRQVRGWSWDLESNTKIEMEDDFRKLIFRKGKGWVIPDERDLRELTNRRGAILTRNCLLQLLPKDLIEDALAACRETLKKGAEQDPDSARKKIILAFSSLNITPEMLEKLLDHPLAEATPNEITMLRTVYTSIRDGNSTWHEYMEAKGGGGGSDAPKAGGTEKGTLTMDDLKAPEPQPAAPAQPPTTAVRTPEASTHATLVPSSDKTGDSGIISQDEYTILQDAFRGQKKLREADVLAFAKQCAFERGKNVFVLSKLERADYERVVAFIREGKK